MQITLEHDTDGATSVSAAFLRTTDKDEALNTLAEAAASLCTGLSGDAIARLAREREAIATSIVSEDIAFPHAVEAGNGDSVVVVGVCRTPLVWDPPDRSVRLIVLFAGGDRRHLAAMSSIARILRTPGVTDAIAAAGSEHEALRIIAAHHTDPGDRAVADGLHVANDALLAAARDVSAAVPYSELAVVADTFSDRSRLRESVADFRGFLLSASLEEDRSIPAKWITDLRLPKLDEVAVEREVERLSIVGAFEDRQVLVVAYGARASDRLSTIRLITVAHGRSQRLLAGVHHVISRRVLQLAREIAAEGREGKPVGCLFVIGAEEELAEYTHQLIVNPFLGYPEEARNILDPSLEETIKEFSKIDGACVIGPDGTVASAGTYIAVTSEHLDLRPGEGARHATARAVTGVTHTVTIAVSESTGRVSVYVGGRRSL
ncbi:MAG: diadenylate cyclase [Spirochaetales bacterium]|nr:diadenylate cyclase [Spirochaetales bacterium]